MRAHVNLSFKDDSTEVEIAETEATDSGVVEDQMADPDEDDADDGGVVLEDHLVHVQVARRLHVVTNLK